MLVIYFDLIPGFHISNFYFYFQNICDCTYFYLPRSSQLTFLHILADMLAELSEKNQNIEELNSKLFQSLQKYDFKNAFQVCEDLELSVSILYRN